MRSAEERIVVRQLEHLRMSGVSEFAVAVADIDRPQARHAVEDAIALAIEDVRSFASDDHTRTVVAQRLMVRERMQMMLRVEVLDLICLKPVGHWRSLQQSLKVGRAKAACSRALVGRVADAGAEH